MTDAQIPQPRIEFLPMHGAVAANRSTTLDVLIRILPPEVELGSDRPPLNLGLVIDRSGSMAGAKIDYAKRAAQFAVENLLPSDRISVTLFDTHVNTLIPSTLATDKTHIIQQIQRIRAGSSTALHQGWVEGGMQVSQYLNPEHLNRVILLSDGLANVGETQPDVIANDVHGLSKRGVGTTTMGVGDDYSEDLLESMARSGDGNFYHIQSPDQLPSIFESELMGLSSTLGQKVSLGLKLQNGAALQDVLNDFDLTNTGRYQLPNLVVGSPINVVMRLRIPALTSATELCTIRLAWDDPHRSDRQVITASFSLPVVSVEQLSDFPADPTVAEQVALLMAARARQEAVVSLSQGDSLTAMSALKSARSLFEAMPASPAAMQEMDALQDLETDLSTGQVARARKKSMSQRYNLQRSRPSQPPQPPTDQA